MMMHWYIPGGSIDKNYAPQNRALFEVIGSLLPEVAEN
jgi:hypothetical protein